MNNKQLGNQFEEETAWKLCNAGYWVHRMAPGADGSQPADLVAIKNKCAVIVDCKVCMNDEFPFSRIEYNQRFAMKNYMDKTCYTAWFCLRTNACDYMISFENMLKAEEMCGSRMKLEDIQNFGMTIGTWCIV